MTNEVRFKVNGGELENYISGIQKKSQALTNEALKGALAQTEASKQQLSILHETIRALEKKNRLESQASRSILLEQRESALTKNRDLWEGKRETVFGDRSLSEKEKKERIGGLYGLENAIADKIKGDYKDNLQVVREQSNQSKLQTTLAKENISTLKQTAERNVSAIMKGDMKIAEVINSAQTDEEKLVAKLTQQGLEKEKKRENKDQEKDSVFNALLKTDLIRQAGGMVGQIPNAKSELEFIRPMTALLAAGIGGALGSAVDLITGSKFLGTGVGQTNLGLVGVELGKIVGDFVGGSLERSYQGREDLTNKNFLLQALTGKDFEVDAFGNNGLGATGKSRITGDLSRYGLDYSQTADMQYQLAQRQGYGRNLEGGAENAIALEKGLGVNRDAIFQIVELQRSSSKDNRDFLRTISGIHGAGKNGIFKDDRTFLTEFIGRFNTLQRELLKTQGQVATGTTMDLLMKFDSIGGQFSARDPRSGGLLSSLNNSLINPSSDFKKSLSYYVLRQKLGANASIADIIQEQQKGLGSEGYSSGMMKLYSTMGDDSSRRLAFADFFGGNVDAGTKALRAYQSGKLKNGAWFGKELSGGMGEDDLRSLAEGQVGKYSKSTAEINNMFVDSVAVAVAGVGDKMKDLFGSMLDELENFIVNRIKGGTTTNAEVYKNNKAKPIGSLTGGARLTTGGLNRK
jgi:hypothetical protein